MDKISLEIKAPVKVGFEHQLEYTNFRGEKFPHDFRMQSLAKQTVERLSAWVKEKPESCDREDLELLGLHLYNILFPPDSKPREEFEKDLEYVRNQQSDSDGTTGGERLRLNIIFPANAEELAAYPWEFLCRSAGSGNQNVFLVARQTQLILTRFVPPKSLSNQPDEKKLRILVAYAAPKELGMLETEGGSNDPNTLIAQLENLGNTYPENIQVEVLRSVTYRDLQQHVKGFAPHVVHFIGHGRPGELAVIQTQDELEKLKALGRKNEEAHWINAKTVSDLFVEWKPRLVFLSACDSAASLRGMTDVASHIIRNEVNEIPAVIAMQYPIDNSDAALFASTFYQQLSAGSDIDKAVKEGRKVLGDLPKKKGQTWSDRVFATPLVYLKSEAAIIPKPKKTGQSGTAAQVPAGKIGCPYPDCDALVSIGGKFCIKCRRALDKCPDCGRPIMQASTLCGQCGWGMSPPSVTAAAAAPGAEIAGAVSSGAQTAFSNAVASAQPAAQLPLRDPRLRYQQ